MKEGWEIVNIGSICNIITGKLDANASSENGVYPFFTCSRESLKIDNYAYDCECVLIAGNGDLNVKYYKGKFNAYQRTYIVTLKNDIKDVSVKYIFKFFEKYVEKLRQLSVGGVIKYIKLGDLTNAKIPVPPLPEQEKIVMELDCLSGIIEKKKQQLKELDSLAQSIFYEMFGDPVENEKGWEVKKFKDCYKLTSGKNLTAKQIVDGDYPVYGGNGIVGYHNDYNLDGDNIIIGRVGALCGNVRNVLGKSFITDNAFILTKLEIGINVFVLYLLSIHDLRQYARDALQPVISNAGFQNIEIILPPLSLQQQFANKIELIEKQKELIKQSIKETETLFDSRMDYYFNS